VAAAACAPAAAQTRLDRIVVVSGVVPCNTGTLIDVASSPAFPGTPPRTVRCGGHSGRGHSVTLSEQ
jgi:hypothetical protein